MEQGVLLYMKSIWRWSQGEGGPGGGEGVELSFSIVLWFIFSRD
jgi:hypothetical protein